MAQNLMVLTATKKNNVSRTASSILLNSGRVIDIETKESGASTLIRYAEKNRKVTWYVTDNYSVVADYVDNYDAGKFMIVDLLEKKGRTYSKTVKLNMDSVIMAWADSSDSNKSYIIYDETPNSKSLPVKYKVDHSLLELTVLSGDVTTTSTTTTTTTTTTTV